MQSHPTCRFDLSFPTPEGCSTLPTACSKQAMALPMHTTSSRVTALGQLNATAHHHSSRRTGLRPGALLVQSPGKHTRQTCLCLPTSADQRAAVIGAVPASDGMQYLEGLAGKSFHCTACGKCCTMAADAEVRQACVSSWLCNACSRSVCRHVSGLLQVVPATARTA